MQTQESPELQSGSHTWAASSHLPSPRKSLAQMFKEALGNVYARCDSSTGSLCDLQQDIEALSKNKTDNTSVCLACLDLQLLRQCLLHALSLEQLGPLRIIITVVSSNAGSSAWDRDASPQKHCKGKQAQSRKLWMSRTGTLWSANIFLCSMIKLKAGFGLERRKSRYYPLAQSDSTAPCRTHESFPFLLCLGAVMETHFFFFS